jgi:hypothetical protein
MVSGHAVYDDGVLRITRTCEQPGLAIAGEIDESTYAGLVEALAELAALPGEVHLSLASVEYCDRWGRPGGRQACRAARGPATAGDGLADRRLGRYAWLVGGQPRWRRSAGGRARASVSS